MYEKVAVAPHFKRFCVNEARACIRLFGSTCTRETRHGWEWAWAQAWAWACGHEDEHMSANMGMHTSNVVDASALTLACEGIIVLRTTT